MNALAPVSGTVVSLGLWALRPHCVYGGWRIDWSSWNHGGRSFDGPVEDWWPTNDPTLYASQAECEEAIRRHLRAHTPMGDPPD